MQDYSSLNFDQNLRSLDSPLRKREFTSRFDFQTQIQRGAVSNTKFGTISADIVKGGTMSANYIGGGTMSANYLTGGTINTGLLGVGTLDAAVDIGIGAGGAYVRLDGPNNRIIVNDGTVDRIIIGSV